MKRVGLMLGLSSLLMGSFEAAAQLPSSYDARDEGLITSIKNQSRLGTCWAFSAVSLLETACIKAGLGTVENTDFSEWQIANYAHQQSYNDYTAPYTGASSWGGEMYDPIYYAQAQFSSVFLNEAASPYPLEQIAAKETLSPPSQQLPTLGNAIVSTYARTAISSDYLSATEVQQFKNEILNCGSVSIGMTWSRNALSTYNGNEIYNNTTGANEGGHAIVAIGWDDFFQVSDTQQGAFIMKNSWDNSWGNDGCFYLAYDSYVGGEADATWVEVKDGSNLTYAYSTMPEPDGTDGNYSDAQYTESTASAIAAKMLLDSARTEDDTLVSLGLNTCGGEVQIQLYGSQADAIGDGSGESLLYEDTCVFDCEGFQVIDLNEAVDVSDVDELWVVYSAASGDTRGYTFEEGALTEDYCYYLNGDTWEGSSTTNHLAPVSFYMIPEPGTLFLLLSAGGGLLILRRLRM